MGLYWRQGKARSKVFDQFYADKGQQPLLTLSSWRFSTRVSTQSDPAGSQAGRGLCSRMVKTGPVTFATDKQLFKLIGEKDAVDFVGRRSGTPLDKEGGLFSKKVRRTKRQDF